jgi:hypothetical protein
MPVTGYSGRYEVSRAGEIRRADGRLVGLIRRKDGYVLVRLSGPRALLRVHRVVAEAFLPNPDSKPFVNHLDCNPANNTAQNLEWCTQAENIGYASSLGRMQTDYWTGRRSPNAKLTDQQAQEIRIQYASGGASWAFLADQYGVGKRTIGKIIKGQSYAPVQP